MHLNKHSRIDGWVIKSRSCNDRFCFEGFLPADNPQIIVYVAIDNPKGITQYGGTVHALLSENKDNPLFYKGL